MKNQTSFNMNQLRYVCISDFHLGAPNSLLTGVEPQVRDGQLIPNPLEITRTLATFAEALRQFIPTLHPPGERPTLILLGDVLDLGFSPPNVVVMAYQRLVEAFFPPDKPPLFAKDIIFIPGNHDHNLWQSEKTQHFLNQIKSGKSKSIPPFTETTPMLASPSITCRLLTEVINEYDHLSHYTVKISYPNIAFVNAQRAVFLHHGHFIESMYRLISEIGTTLFGENINGNRVNDLERINGTWIDFLWSGLGQVGDRAYNLYSLMQDGAALHQFTSRLAKKIESQLLPSLSMSGLKPVQQLGLGISKGILDAAIGRFAELERTSYENVLSGGSLNGLKWYVNEVIKKQFDDESDRPCPDDVSFIFGHTHKPFEDELVLNHFRFPVKVYNSGGWVLDVPEMVSTQGGAMVLIDDDLRVASIRLFSDPVNGQADRMNVHGTGGFPDESNPFLSFLRQQLKDKAVVWQAFTLAVKEDMETRAALMQHQFFNPAGTAPPQFSIS
jgi:hypothetical protein